MRLIPYQPGEDRRNPRSGKGTRKSRIYRAQPGARRKGTLAGRRLRHIRAAAAARAGSSYQRRTAAYIGFTYIGKSTLDNPTLEKPTQEKPTLENPTQLNKDILSKEQSITDLSSTDSIPFHSLNPLPFAHGEAATPPERKRTEAKSNSAVEIYREIIKDNIEYDHLIQNCKIDKDRLDEIVDLMLETVCTARKTIRIAGDDYPAELVKSKFLKLNSSHIEFVLDCMRENTTKVRNIKQYLKAVLFNAPSTIDSYYTALVNHDLYGGE